jgi:hypothetical protein
MRLENDLQRKLRLARRTRTDLTSHVVGNCLAHASKVGISCAARWGCRCRGSDRCADASVRAGEIGMVEDIE